MVSFLRKALLLGLTLADDQASYTEDAGGLFRTMQEHPERVKLEQIDGEVPSWLKGSMFRNGPGQYEYGQDHFKHIFDPSAIIQKIEFDNGDVHYQVIFKLKIPTKPMIWVKTFILEQIHRVNSSSCQCRKRRHRLHRNGHLGGTGRL